MPLCVHCAHPADHLYTTYKTKSNIRLAVCAQCGQFADPLIEHDQLIILLDLILLKPRVFLHLLFNRGSPPLDATAPSKSSVTGLTDPERDQRIRYDVLRMGLAVVVAETISRHVQQPMMNAQSWMQAAVMVIAELVAQHLTTLAVALAVLSWRGWYPVPRAVKNGKDGRQLGFIPWLIPLTLLYTSLLPLLLQLFLSIWYSRPGAHPDGTYTYSQIAFPASLPYHDILQDLLNETLTLWNNGDRIWIGTRLLGGMSAGFGLRVLLPTRPSETTMLVLAGWGAAAATEMGMLRLFAR